MRSFYRMAKSNTMEMSQQIEAVCQRALVLRKYAIEAPVQQHLLAEALQDLYLVLEELQTSQEELRQQNQELIATRQIADLERQRYRALFDLAPNGYLVTDLQGNIHQANHHAAARLFCTPHEYLVNKPLLVFIYEPDRTLFQSRLANLRPDQDWEVTLHPPNGALIAVSITVTRMQDPQRAGNVLLWSLHEITSRR